MCGYGIAKEPKVFVSKNGFVMMKTKQVCASDGNDK